MKRRKFLQVIGAAAAVPALPTMAGGLTPQIKVMAAAHAKKYPFVSVIGISRRMGVTGDVAQDLLGYMWREGLVGPIKGSASGAVSAASTVFRPTTPPFDPVAAQRARRRELAGRRAARAAAEAQKPGMIPAWLRHLQRLCQAQGMALHPRAAGAVA